MVLAGIVFDLETNLLIKCPISAKSKLGTSHENPRDAKGSLSKSGIDFLKSPLIVLNRLMMKAAPVAQRIPSFEMFGAKENPINTSVGG